MQATLHWSIRKFHHANKSSAQESLGTYFRSWGIHTPGDVAGAIGGKNGEGKATEFFVVRTRIPNGILRSDQGLRGWRGTTGAALRCFAG